MRLRTVALFFTVCAFWVSYSQCQEKTLLCEKNAHSALGESRYEEAEEGFRSGLTRALAANNDDQAATCYFYLGHVLQEKAGTIFLVSEKRSLLGQALAMYERASALRPTASTMYNKALVLIGLNRRQEAAIAFDAALNTADSTQKPTILTDYAVLSEQLGRWSEAKDLYHELTLIDPHNSKAHEALMGIIIEHEPHATYDYIFESLSSGNPIAAQEAALRLWRSYDLTAEEKEVLLILIAMSLAQDFSLADFRDVVVNSLAVYVSDGDVGAGIREMMSLEQGQMSSKLYKWWSDGSTSRYGLPISRLSAFRELIFAVGISKKRTSTREAESYFILSYQLNPAIPAARSYRQIALIYDSKKTLAQLREYVEQWNRSMSGEGTQAADANDLVDYYNTIARISRIGSWSRDAADILSTEYNLAAALRSAGDDPALLESVGYAFAENLFLERASEVLSTASAAYLKDGFEEKGQQLEKRSRDLLIKSRLYSPPRGGGGGGGGSFNERWHHGIGGCVAGPGGCFSASSRFISREKIFRNAKGDGEVLMNDSPSLCGMKALSIGASAGTRSHSAQTNSVYHKPDAGEPTHSFKTNIELFSVGGPEPDRRITLSQRPSWVFFGTWTSDDNLEITLFDALRKKRLVYDTKGHLKYVCAGDSAARQLVISSYQSCSLESNIVAIRSSQSGLFPEVNGNSVFTSANTQQDTAGRNLLARLGIANGIKSIYAWTPLDAGGLLALGFFELEVGTFSVAFAGMDSSSPNGFEIIYPLRISDVDYYLFGNPYVATIGDRGYFMTMEDFPALLEIEARRNSSGHTHWESSRIELSDIGGIQPIALPSEGGLHDVTSRAYGALEKFSGPAGIYSWGRFVYIVLRQWESRSGHTKWTVLKFDPRLREVVRRTELPTSANHLTVIPGLEYWAFVEKGPVEAFGVQQIPTILLLPATEVEGTKPQSGPMVQLAGRQLPEENSHERGSVSTHSHPVCSTADQREVKRHRRAQGR